MVWLAISFPKTKFLCFTKKYDEIDFYDIPDNLQIVFSVWPNEPLPPTNKPFAFMQDGTENRIFNAIKCKNKCDKCNKCFNLTKIKKNVVFNKH